MSPHAAQFTEALAWLDFFTGWAPGQTWMPLTIWSPGQQFARVEHHHVGQPGTTRPRRYSSRQILQDWIRHLDLEQNAQVHLGLPRQIPDGGAATTTTVLWTTVTGAEQNRRLSWLPLEPDLVIREGNSSRRTCLWALQEPMRWTGVHRANRRIAYRLGAVQKTGEPERLEIPAPGTCLRRDRTRPVPVVVERLVWAVHPWQQLIGRLKDAPDADAWRNHAA